MLLKEMEIFYHIVDTGGFSKAADRLHVSKSFVSKKIKRLEADLKVKLIYRDSRKFKLTPEGETFYSSCRDVVFKGQEGYEMIQSIKGDVSGELIISLPPAVSKYLIEPMLPKFMTMYPHISLTCKLESRVTNVVEEGYDVVFRSVGSLSDSSLIARQFLTYDSYLCASPNYLKHHGKIESPNDLTKHDFVLYHAKKTSKGSSDLVFEGGANIKINGVIYSDNLEFIKNMVLNDMGLGIFPYYMVEENLEDATLIRCLHSSPLPKGIIHMIYPEKDYVLPKVRVFIDYIFDSLQVYDLS